MNAPALGPCPHCGQEHPESVLVCPVKQEQMPLPGRLLAGKFRFERLLGEGGMGSVWQASNVLVRKAVAIKLMRPEIASNPAILARFRNEATAAGQIGSPHICDILDFGPSELGPYIVMELMRGRPLNDLIEKTGRVDPALAVIVVRQALEGLDAAHRAGIIHRDLKPENIFLSEPAPGRLLVKLMDFGISKFSQASSEGGRTGVGVLMGTPEYMSPEQSQGAANVDERTDLWAMGLILYKALSGVDAFAGPTVAATLVAVATREPPPLEELVPGIHPGLVEIIRRCTAKDPAQRYSSARELSDVLAPFEALAGMMPAGGPPPPHHPGPMTAGPMTAGPGPMTAGPGPMTAGPMTAGPRTAGPGPMTAGPTAGPSFTAAPPHDPGAHPGSQGGTFSNELGGPTPSRRSLAPEDSWSIGVAEIRDERPTSKPTSGGGNKTVTIVVAALVLIGIGVGGWLAFGGSSGSGETGGAAGVGPASAGVVDASGGASKTDASAGTGGPVVAASGGDGGAAASAGATASGGDGGAVAASAGAPASGGDASAGAASGGDASASGGEAATGGEEPKGDEKGTTKTIKKKKPTPKDVVAAGSLYTPKSPAEPMQRSVARDHCKKLEHGGRDDWELASVSEAEKFRGKGIPQTLYWTVELVSGKRDEGKAINLRKGEVSERPITELARPLCITHK